MLALGFLRMGLEFLHLQYPIVEAPEHIHRQTDRQTDRHTHTHAHWYWNPSSTKQVKWLHDLSSLLGNKSHRHHSTGVLHQNTYSFPPPLDSPRCLCSQSLHCSKDKLWGLARATWSPIYLFSSLNEMHSLRHPVWTIFFESRLSTVPSVHL